MRTVYKYSLSISDRIVLKIPGLLKFLKADTQGGKLCLWAEVANENPEKEYVICVYGTGHPIPPNLVLEHIDTVMDGRFVWHVYTQPHVDY